MEITIQQNVSDKGRLPYRHFKLKNGFYENSTYDEEGAPIHYLIVACLSEGGPYTEYATVPQAYIDKFYPNFDDGHHFIILGDAKAVFTDENPFIHLQELAIKLAEKKGLIPEYTLLDIFKNRFDVPLHGYKKVR